MELGNETHAVYFLDGQGRLIGEMQRVPHGGTAQPPAYDAPDSMVFVGWSRDTTRVEQDIYCVALLRGLRPNEPDAAQAKRPPKHRVHVLDLRGGRAGDMVPLGSWGADEMITPADLECLHLRNTARLPAFRLQVNTDALLVLTYEGVRAFDLAMRPLEMLALVSAVEAETPEAEAPFCALARKEA
jgi:hypothetical protein